MPRYISIAPSTNALLTSMRAASLAEGHPGIRHLHLKTRELPLQTSGVISCSPARRHKQLMAPVDGVPVCVSLPADSAL